MKLGAVVIAVSTDTKYAHKKNPIPLNGRGLSQAEIDWI
jgi:hypothetical protein